MRLCEVYDHYDMKYVAAISRCTTLESSSSYMPHRHIAHIVIDTVSPRINEPPRRVLYSLVWDQVVLRNP